MSKLLHHLHVSGTKENFTPHKRQINDDYTERNLFLLNLAVALR
jgi:hypothetical protein